MGTMQRDQRLPLPSADRLEALFPDPFNVDTWNLAAISPLVTHLQHRRRRLQRPPLFEEGRAAGCRTTGRSRNRLTLNLGLRYDLELGVFANDVGLPPFQEAGRPDDKNNFQPRVGFAYQVNERPSLRGGSGLYYGDALGADQSFATGNAQIAVIQYTNDGRADFAANPTNGQPLPTYAQAQRSSARAIRPRSRWRDQLHRRRAVSDCATSRSSSGRPKYVAPAAHVPDVDRLPASDRRHDGVRGRLRLQQGRPREGRRRQHQPDVQPGDGRQLPVRESRARGRIPDWGVVSMNTHLGRSAYHALQTAFTKRFSNRWQALGDVHAVGAVERRHAPVQRPGAGPVRDRTRSRR